jgi:hypothetical protein
MRASDIPMKTTRFNLDVNPDQREYVAEVLQRGDYVRISPSIDDGCQVCHYEIGVDYDMYDYEDRWWWVDRVCEKTAWNLPCGCRVFEIDDWFFSTCWVDAVDIKTPPEPSWEV